MYVVKNNKTNGTSNNKLSFDGYVMPSRHGFSIDGDVINNIKLTNKKMISPIVSSLVIKKFNKLIDKLTELFVSDSDDGSNYREALDRIEKFRLIIKNKYREYLSKKDIEMMSKKLKLLQAEAFKKLLLFNEVNILGKNNYRGGK